MGGEGWGRGGGGRGGEVKGSVTCDARVVRGDISGSTFRTQDGILQSE